MHLVKFRVRLLLIAECFIVIILNTLLSYLEKTLRSGPSKVLCLFSSVLKSPVCIEFKGYDSFSIQINRGTPCYLFVKKLLL